MRIISPAIFRARTAAFTLLELLVVMVIMGILLATSAPGLVQSISANRLTASGQGLQYAISYAQQLAVTQNRQVALRFYLYDREGVAGCHAYQICYLDPATNTSIPVSNPDYLGDGSVFIPETDLSPLLTAKVTGEALAAEFEPFASMNAKFRRIIFMPSGSLNLAAPLRESYLTLVETQPWVVSGGATPPNFVTVQIDPVTGRARAYRP